MFTFSHLYPTVWRVLQSLCGFQLQTLLKTLQSDENKQQDSTRCLCFLSVSGEKNDKDNSHGDHSKNTSSFCYLLPTLTNVEMTNYWDILWKRFVLFKLRSDARGTVWCHISQTQSSSDGNALEKLGKELIQTKLKNNLCFDWNMSGLYLPWPYMNTRSEFLIPVFDQICSTAINLGKMEPRQKNSTFQIKSQFINEVFISIYLFLNWEVSWNTISLWQERPGLVFTAQMIDQQKINQQSLKNNTSFLNHKCQKSLNVIFLVLLSSDIHRSKLNILITRLRW